MQPNPYQSPKHPAQPAKPKNDSATSPAALEPTDTKQSYVQLMRYFVFPGIWIGLMASALGGLTFGFIGALFFVTMVPAILKLVDRTDTRKTK